MKITPTIIILTTGITLASIVYYNTPPPQMILIKNDQYYNSDTLEPIEIKGTLHKLGIVCWDSVHGGIYTLFEVRGPPYGTYIMITIIIATLLTWAITKYRKLIQNYEHSNF